MADRIRLEFIIGRLDDELTSVVAIPSINMGRLIEAVDSQLGLDHGRTSESGPSGPFLPPDGTFGRTAGRATVGGNGRNAQ